MTTELLSSILMVLAVMVIVAAVARTLKDAPSHWTRLGRWREILAFALVVAVGWPSLSRAGTMVTVISPRTIKVINPGATLDLLAYSESTDMNGKTVKNGVASNGVVAGATIKPLTTLVPVPKEGFSPVVGFTGLKPKPVTRTTVTSTSKSDGGPSDDARITYIPPADMMMPSMNGILDASAAHSIETQKTKGFSAVKGVDPDMLPMGVYDYPVTINLLSLSVSPGDFGYASVFATDSRFTDPLWVLNVIATAPTTSSSLSLNVLFSSNSLLALDDMAITNRVKRDLQNSGGTLSNYSLFHTTYDVSVSGTVYGEGVEAIAGTPVPEPSTLALIVSGGLLSVAVWWGRVKHRSEGAV